MWVHLYTISQLQLDKITFQGCVVCMERFHQFLCESGFYLTLYPLSQDVHVFALEKENTSLGQRIYLVTSYTELWHYYRYVTLLLLHYYYTNLVCNTF